MDNKIEFSNHKFFTDKWYTMIQVTTIVSKLDKSGKRGNLVLLIVA